MKRALASPLRQARTLSVFVTKRSQHDHKRLSSTHDNSRISSLLTCPQLKATGSALVSREKALVKVMLCLLTMEIPRGTKTTSTTVKKRLLKIWALTLRWFQLVRLEGLVPAPLTLSDLTVRSARLRLSAPAQCEPGLVSPLTCSDSRWTHRTLIKKWIRYLEMLLCARVSKAWIHHNVVNAIKLSCLIRLRSTRTWPKTRLLSQLEKTTAS